MEEWRRSICDSLDQDGISPTTGANRRSKVGVWIWHAETRPLLPLFSVSSEGMVKLFLLRTPSPLPLPGCMLWNQHFPRGAPPFWVTSVMWDQVALLAPVPAHSALTIQCPWEVHSSVMPRFFLSPAGGRTNQNHISLGKSKLPPLLTLSQSCSPTQSCPLFFLFLSVLLSRPDSLFHRHHWERQCWHRECRQPEIKSNLCQEAKSSCNSDVFPPSSTGKDSRIHGSFQKHGKLQGRKAGSNCRPSPSSVVHRQILGESTHSGPPSRVHPVQSRGTCMCLHKFMYGYTCVHVCVHV